MSVKKSMLVKGCSKFQQRFESIEAMLDNFGGYCSTQEPPKRGQKAFPRHSGEFSAMEEVYTYMSCVPNFVLDNGKGKKYLYGLYIYFLLKRYDSMGWILKRMMETTLLFLFRHNGYRISINVCMSSGNWSRRLTKSWNEKLSCFTLIVSHPSHSKPSARP